MWLTYPFSYTQQLEAKDVLSLVIGKAKGARRSDERMEMAGVCTKLLVILLVMQVSRETIKAKESRVTTLRQIDKGRRGLERLEEIRAERPGRAGLSGRWYWTWRKMNLSRPSVGPMVVNAVRLVFLIYLMVLYPPLMEDEPEPAPMMLLIFPDETESSDEEEERGRAWLL